MGVSRALLLQSGLLLDNVFPLIKSSFCAQQLSVLWEEISGKIYGL